jgi:hypothetical protein
MRLESFGAVEGVVIPVRSLSAFGRVGEGGRVGEWVEYNPLVSLQLFLFDKPGNCGLQILLATRSDLPKRLKEALD